MDNWLNFVEPLALAGTLIVTLANLFFTRSLSHSNQQTEVMTKMRSERIKDMREHSAGIITCCQKHLHDLDDKDTKRELLHYGHSLISLLQYYSKYPIDMDLISTTHKIIDLCLADEIDKNKLFYSMRHFWEITNAYIGADFERLKNESLGKINYGGLSRKEATDFSRLYDQFYEGRFQPEPQETEKQPVVP